MTRGDDGEEGFKDRNGGFDEMEGGDGRSEAEV